MKLSFEMKDGRLEYSIEIGATKKSGTRDWCSEDVRFLIKAEDWLHDHMMRPDTLTQANSVVDVANEFIKQLLISTGHYELAAQMLKEIRKGKEKAETVQKVEEKK